MRATRSPNERVLKLLAAAVHQCFDIAALLRLRDDLVHIAADAGEALKVRLDIFLRLVHRHADVLREREGGDAIHDAEVDGLRVRAHLLGDLISRHAEDLRGRDGVDVLAGQKRLLHRLVVRDVREQPQLDLAVVRVNEHAAA